MQRPPTLTVSGAFLLSDSILALAASLGEYCPGPGHCLSVCDPGLLLFFVAGFQCLRDCIVMLFL